MKLIEAGELSQKLDDLLESAHHLDIAVAWVQDGDILEKILKFSQQQLKTVRIVTGVWGWGTSAKALRKLKQASNVELRIVHGETGKPKFHPKLYVFYLQEKFTTWIGSANLTHSAFSSNIELVAEFEGSNESERIFSKYWNSPTATTESDWEDWIAVYEAKEISIRKLGITAIPDFDANTDEDGSDGQPFIGFIDSLKTGPNAKWLPGYVHLLRMVRPIFKKDWRKPFESKDRDMLLGLTEPWKWLGDLGAAGTAVGLFSNDGYKAGQTRAEIQEQLKKLSTPESQISTKMIQAVFESITQFSGLSKAVASRLLCLAYPDRFVSVNSASETGLCNYFSSALPRLTVGEIGTAKGYARLNSILRSQDWWKATRPPEQELGELWDFRAALVDLVVYRSTV